MWASNFQLLLVYSTFVLTLIYRKYADGIANSGIPPPADVAGFTSLTTMDIAQHRSNVQSIIQKDGTTTTIVG